MNFAGRIDVTIAHTQRAFGKLCGHADKTQDNHPECRTRPALGNRNRDPRDIPQSDRSRQGCSERLEMGNLARIVRLGIFAPNRSER